MVAENVCLLVRLGPVSDRLPHVDASVNDVVASDVRLDVDCIDDLSRIVEVVNMEVVVLCNSQRK